MKKTEVSFDIGTLPPAIARYMQGATIYDSSCSETARTLLVKGAQSAFLKISPQGTLEREYKMTDFLHSFQAAPKAIAYESDSDYDYLLTEVVSGDDGAERVGFVREAVLPERSWQDGRWLDHVILSVTREGFTP